MKKIKLTINNNLFLKKSERQDKYKSTKYDSNDFVDFDGKNESDFFRFLIKIGKKDFSNIATIETLDLSNLKINNCDFSNCDFRDINFSNSELKNVNFDLTDIFSKSEFKNSDLENVSFQNSRINTDFEGVLLFKNIDFSANYIGFNIIEKTFLRNPNIFNVLKKRENQVRFNENTCFSLNRYMSTYYTKSKEFLIYLSESDKKITDTICNWEKFFKEEKQSNCLPKPQTQSYQDLKNNFSLIKEKIDFLKKLI